MGLSETIASADLGWAAGLVDGEGCIRLMKHHGRRCFTVILHVVNTDPRIVARFKALFGVGVIREITQKRGRPLWRWQVHSATAAGILELLRPHLVAKREQADIAISFRLLHRRRGGNIHDPVQRAANEALWQRQLAADLQMKALKRHDFRGEIQ